MRRLFLLCLLVTWPTVAAMATAADVSLSFNSGRQRVSVLELYTSEGCSSCPPADAWLRRWRRHPDLWLRIIPLAFHVDYWNYLGWQDRYARSEFSQRQRRYALLGAVSAVYTPGFVRDGREWRGWLRGDDAVLAAPAPAGELKVRLQAGKLSASYDADPAEPALKLWLATLAFDQQSAVSRGENSGHVLHHDFVVQTLTRYAGHKQQDRWTWQLDYAPPVGGAEQKAIVFWVTVDDDPTPRQATGGWLP